MSRAAKTSQYHQLTDQELARLDSQAPALADYIRQRRQRGVHTLGRSWHRGS